MAKAKSSDSSSCVSVDIRDNGVAVLTFDIPDEKMNTLSERSASDLKAAFDSIDGNKAVKAIVLISGKNDNFIAGADITMMQKARTAMEVERLSRDMQTQLARIEDSDVPVVAAIHGACLGGGLEVALACHYRIATDHGKTVLALPEVMLGLLPGGGGTQRLPRLVGLQDALDMMLTGKNIRPHKAKKIGLVDDVVLPYGLEDTAVKAAASLAEGKLERRELKKSNKDRALEDTAPGRALVFRQARAMIQSKTQGLFPAPFAILDVVEEGLDEGMDAGLAAESARFGDLAMTDVAKNLMSLFFAQTSLKKNRFGKPDQEVRTVGVLGAGLMGAGIGLVSVLKGHRVLLKDVSLEGVGRGKKQIYTELNKRARRRAITNFERDTLMSNVVGQTDYAGFENADLVIEAVFEDLKLKHRVIEELEQHISDDCVFASNTSALPIGDIAQASKRKENVVGMHYFSPVHKMPLLEVITTKDTSKRAAQIAVDVGLKQGKTVIVVNDGPGFYTSRILAPFMDESAFLALEGIDLHKFDKIMKQFGFPVGPITLLDEVGIDVAAHVSHDMEDFFEPRWGKRDTTALEAMVKADFRGRKAGKGFFIYNEEDDDSPIDSIKKFVKKAAGRETGKPVNPGALEIFAAHGVKPGSKTFDATEVQNRMVLRMVNEAVLCLEDGVLNNPTDGDVGAVFGLGFPPGLGGPFRYIDSEGAGEILSRMEALAAKFDKRFKPAALLVDHAKSGKPFHKS